MQHGECETKRAIQVISTNKNGYILALKSLKYMFRQKSQISQAYISKLTRGKSISNDDDKALLEYCYTMSDCVVAHQAIKLCIWPAQYRYFMTNNQKNIVSKSIGTRDHH